MPCKQTTKKKVAAAPDKPVNTGKKSKSSIELTEQELNRVSGGWECGGGGAKSEK